MQQARISQYFQAKKVTNEPQPSSAPASSKSSSQQSVRTPNFAERASSSATKASEIGSDSKKRVRDDIPVIELIDEEEDCHTISKVISTKDKIQEVLSRNEATSALKRQKFQRVVFQNEALVEYDDEFEEVIDEQEEAQVSTKKQVFTPLETQVVNIRKQYPDCLLMVECGYRMRFFGQDAVNASKILGIYAHQDHNFMVASVPTYRASFHCQRLLSAGQKVAIVRQTETAALRKGSSSKSSTFDRKVSGVFTQGTMIDGDDPAFEGLTGLFAKKSNDDESDDDGEGNEEETTDIDTAAVFSEASNQQDVWITSLYEEEATEVISVISINICAHKIWITSMPLDSLRQGLLDFLDIVQPSELIFPESISPQTKSRIEQRSYLHGGMTTQTIHSLYLKLLRSFNKAIFERHPESFLGLQPGTEWFSTLAITEKRALHGAFHYLKEFSLLNVFVQPILISSTGNNVPTSTLSSSIEDDDSIMVVSDNANVSASALTEIDATNSFPLDGITIRDLEIFDTLANTNSKLRKKWKEQIMEFSSSSSGSALSSNKLKSLQNGLFGIIDNCHTVYGKRTLKNWLMNPLSNRVMILQRQELIEWFLPAVKNVSTPSSSSSSSVEQLSIKQRQIIYEIMHSCLDIEKLLTSLQFNRISFPRLIQLLEFGIKLKCFGEFPFPTQPNSSISNPRLLVAESQLIPHS